LFSYYKASRFLFEEIIFDFLPDFFHFLSEKEFQEKLNFLLALADI